MRCIRCGAVVEHEHAVLCDNCFSKKYTCLRRYKEHTLLICQNCGSFLYQKEWKHQKPKKDAVREAVLHYCDFIHQPDTVTLAIEFHGEHGTVQTGTVTIKTETTIDQQKLCERFTFPLKIKYVCCTTCARAKTHYYEGTLQLRGSNEHIIEQVHQFIIKDAEKIKEKGVFITKIEKVTKGIDYYFTKQQYLPILMKKLVKHFGAVAKTHGELFSKSRLTSKEIYRVNASVRLPDYSVGTVISYKGRLFQLTHLKKYCTAKDLMTGRNMTITEMKDISIKAQPADFKKTEMTKQYPQLEVLHPQTFASVSVKNQRKISKEVKEILVVEINNELWIVN